MVLDFTDENSEFYLGSILAEIRTHLDALHSFLDNVTPDEFSANAMMQDAVLLRIMGIGRLLKKVTGTRAINDKFGLMTEFREVSWNDYKGMSDRIAHDYFELQLTYPWEIIHEDIPRLEDAINRTLARHPNVKKSFDIERGKIEYKNAEKKRNFLDMFRNGSFPGQTGNEDDQK